MDKQDFQVKKSHFTKNVDMKPSPTFKAEKERMLRRTSLEYRMKRREQRRKSYEKKKASCRLLHKEKEEEEKTIPLAAI